MNQSIYLLLFCVIAGVSAFKVHRNDQFIVDDDGLRRVYHGVNVVYKLPPFYPQIQDRFDSDESLSDFDLDNLVSWGLRFIRLHVGWEGVEPVKGQYNVTYLEEIGKIVKRCEAKGITVLLDSHQDVLSRFFCGEGFPDWAVSRSEFSFPFPLINTDIRVDENGVPLIEDCLKLKFAIYYVTTDASKTFDDLFHNTNGIADSFAQYWGYVANYFKEYPNVIGYDILNEPITSSPYRSVYDTLFPNAGNNKNLLGLYKRVHTEIRKFDNEKIIFFEPGTTDLLGAGFNDSPGGPMYRDREVYSYHIYCFYVDDFSIPKNPNVCAAMDTYFFESKERAAKQLGIGKFLTEFGAILDTPEGNRELNFMLSLMETKFTSWAYWEFKYFADITTQAHPGQIESFYNEKGELYVNKVKTLARPYATKICGEPLESFFQPTHDEYYYFILEWNASGQCNGKNTEIFLSREFYFQEKLNYHFKNCGGCQLKEVQKSYYEVVLPKEHREGAKITLVVTDN